ncbi:DUF1549 domain-containing protein [Schlesneria paludicola]|uniref:DUF1549 domain-containing protein n=1 Tax=Schlesneria paludicola TaxID=360056 RepID=UPI0012FA6FDE|nr:DUF1549 domain-containing protein [Schlesneria paludicola]
MSRLRNLLNALAPLLVVGGVVVLVASAARSPIADKSPRSLTAFDAADDSIVCRVDRLIAARWREAGIEPASRADDLTILRRLTLVLHGTAPSLEELRLFESDRDSDRIERWTERILADRRYADYFARRLSRVFVGADQGQFVVFRRDRFWTWLGDQLHSDRPYDTLVRDMISGRGLWTDRPQVNFVAAAVTDNVIDHNKLAGRTARAFLGQRIDCAQCHNHPFADWKQTQFSGLAACFDRVSISLVGIEDNKKDLDTTADRMTQGDVTVTPAVPYHPEWMPEQGTTRQRLAAWVTHSDNRRFDRAIVNRVWGLMFGRPWIDPVDDIPNPHESTVDTNDLLDVLATDFQTHGRSLKRLITKIAAMRVFRMSSQHPAFEQGHRVDDVERVWAAFPVTRLRPEQVIGSMLQASSIKTLDQNSHWTKRAVRFFKELDFVKAYGDLGEDELTERTGTIAQALLRMNSEFSSEWTKGTLFSAAGRISGIATDDDACLDLCFLVCLTRHPTDEERSLLRKQLEGARGDQRTKIVEDLFWSLFNSPEFSWEY